MQENFKIFKIHYPLRASTREVINKEFFDIKVVSETDEEVEIILNYNPRGEKARGFLGIGGSGGGSHGGLICGYKINAGDAGNIGIKICQNLQPCKDHLGYINIE